MSHIHLPHNHGEHNEEFLNYISEILENTRYCVDYLKSSTRYSVWLYLRI